MRPHYSEEWYHNVLKKHGRVRGAGVSSSTARVSRDGAGARPALPSPYKSKLEAAFAAKLDLEKRAGLIKQFWYEPFSIWLPGKVRYKPDFLIQERLPLDDNDIRMLDLVEVKGWSKNRRDGMTRLKVAAALFPCFIWKLAEYHNGQWQERSIA